jgi:mRNA interferase MazF
MPRADIFRGELWWVDWSPGRGSEQSGRRPALVVQIGAANENPRYPNVIVVAISTKGRNLPFHIRLEPSAENALEEVSFAKCEQIFTVSKERLERRLGRITASQMEAVGSALKMVLDLS